jgi:hypothetical protein
MTQELAPQTITANLETKHGKGQLEHYFDVSGFNMTVDGSGDHLLSLEGYDEVMPVLGPLVEVMHTLRQKVYSGSTIKQAVESIDFGPTLPTRRVHDILHRVHSSLKPGDTRPTVENPMTKSRKF